MSKETFQVGCKINLCLKIVGRRKDGYHIIETVFYPLKKPYDTLVITQKPLTDDVTEGITVECNSKEVDLKDNTLTKAYNIFKEITGFAPPLHIELTKNIPIGSGLGGASADAACLIKYLYAKKNKLPYGAITPKDRIRLQKLAVLVGADVPFFIVDTLSYAEGVGEMLHPFELDDHKGNYVLLICPPIHISTAWAFKKLSEKISMILGVNENELENSKKIEKIASFSLTNGTELCINLLNAEKHKNSSFQKELESLYARQDDLYQRAAKDPTRSSSWQNDLERPVFDEYPILKEYKEKLLSFSPDMALMSGSGSSLFALFNDKAKAERAEKYFLEQKDMKVYLSAF